MCDRSPEAEAVVRRYLQRRGFTTRTVDDFSPLLADLVRQVRRADARVVRLRGLKRQVGGDFDADAVAEDFARAILAQNRKADGR